jgi:phosphomannomutase
LIRPSGTEPKLKFYAESRTPLGDSDLTDAEAQAAAGADALLEAIVQRVGLD